MKLRSVALVAFALLLFGTPARADEVVFTPASSAVDFSMNGDNGIDGSGSVFTLTGPSASISGLDFSLSATGNPCSNDGISLSVNGGLIAAVNRGAMAFKAWLAARGVGEFFPSESLGISAAVTGDHPGGSGEPAQSSGTTPY